MPAELTVDQLKTRVNLLERELAEAKRQIATAEARLGEQLIGDLVELAKRARAEYEQRFAATRDPALQHLVHHANAYDFVAWQIKQFMEKKAAATAAAEAEAEAAPPPPPPPSRFDMIDVD